MKKITKKVTVLYAEDDKEVQKATITTLNLFGLVVISANNGAEAYEIYKEHHLKIDLFITDIRMPKLNGIETIKKIRYLNNELPVIIVSGHKEVDFLYESLKLNINSYLLKPIDINKLEASIFSALSSSIIRKHILLENTNLKSRLLSKTKEHILKEKESRYTAMNDIISMIAHQWRQPLASISTVAFNIMHKINTKEFNLETNQGKKDFIFFLKNKLQSVNLYIQNLSSTIDDFRNFYSIDRTYVLCNVQDAINNAYILEKEMIESNNISFIKNYSSKKSIYILKNEIMHVIINLLRNTKDALKKRAIRNPEISIFTKDIEGAVQIDICDNAGGIEKDIINHIFEPYFSTKEEKNGTGIGLYMSKAIIEKHHNGSLYAINKNNGVCFTLIVSDSIQQR